MMTLDVTFLKQDQILGDDALKVMERYGSRAAPTDLAVILGASSGVDPGYTSEGDRPCYFWCASSFGSEVDTISARGEASCSGAYSRDIAARPALSPTEASTIKPWCTMTLLSRIYDSPHHYNLPRIVVGRAAYRADNSLYRRPTEIRVVQYGEYPQTIANEPISKELEKLHESKSLHPTGKVYTFDSVGLREHNTAFKATSYQEYELNGERYIRVPARNSWRQLSNGEVVKWQKPYWVKVEPIEWLVDSTSGWMVAKKCLFSGIQFDTKREYNGGFSKTFMKHYLDNYFAKEIEPVEYAAKREISKRKKLDKDRQGLIALLDSLNEHPATSVRKAAKVAAVREYRKKNPKSSSR